MKKHIELDYEDQTLRGYLDLPQSSGPHPLMIFFHGFTGDCTEYKFLFTRLAKALAAHGVASLRLSFTGSGESDGDFSDISVLDQARQGRAFINYGQSIEGIDPQRIALLGMSLGGCSACLVASELQTQLQGLILLAPAFSYLEKFQQRFSENDEIWSGNLKIGHALLNETESQDFRSALSALKIPVNFFHGTADRSVSPDLSKEFSEFPKDSSLTLIDGTNHGFDTKDGYLILEKGVLQAVKRFFQSTSGTNLES